MRDLRIAALLAALLLPAGAWAAEPACKADSTGPTDRAHVMAEAQKNGFEQVKWIPADPARLILALFIRHIGEPPYPHDDITGAVVGVTPDGTEDVLSFFNHGCGSFTARATDSGIKAQVDAIAGVNGKGA